MPFSVCLERHCKAAVRELQYGVRQPTFDIFRERGALKWRHGWMGCWHKNNVVARLFAMTLLNEFLRHLELEIINISMNRRATSIVIGSSGRLSTALLASFGTTISNSILNI